MSTETMTQELVEQDAHQAILQNLPETCRDCTFAEMQVDQLGWTVALGRLTSERAAELVLERTSCHVGTTAFLLAAQAAEISNF
jgi:hypothetical protein